MGTHTTMISYHKNLFILIVGLIFLLSKGVNAQQSNVDSALVLLNNSIINKEVDMVTIASAIKLLEETTMTLEQTKMVEDATLLFQPWEDEIWPYRLKFTVFRSYIKEDYDRAISYGKAQIEKLDRFDSAQENHPNYVTLRELLGTIRAVFGIKYEFLMTLRLPYRNSDRLEEGLLYFSQKLNQYTLENNPDALYSCHYVLGGLYLISGLIDLANYHIKTSLSYVHLDITKVYWMTGMAVLGYQNVLSKDFSASEYYLWKVFKEYEDQNELQNFFAKDAITRLKLEQNQLDSAAYYLEYAKQGFSERDLTSKASFFQLEAWFHLKMGDLDKAESMVDSCWQFIRKYNIAVAPRTGILAPDYILALVRIEQNRLSEAIHLLFKDIERLNNVKLDILRDYKLMAELYQKVGQPEKAADTYALYIAMKDSLIEKQNRFRSISFETEQQLKQNQLAIEQLESQNQLAATSRNFTIGIALLLLILSGSIYLRFKAKKKANKVLNSTLENLKATQDQLIHAEKMASLGELTAGIAHEIKNPLNFVNNFSELNKEMLEELREEAEKGNLEEVQALANDVIANEEKINHHGKRADAIVKGMLAHSRSGKGEKEPTDLNKLADEYLRLSYHGLRAKDKHFNAEFKTHFDLNLPKVSVIPQDIGRVLLNLINNAFQASSVVEQPFVQVGTKKTENGIEISVWDNGPGIPDDIKDKVFQPFFTTKKGSEGTGLGLSLSYDIVKAHGGEIILESDPGGTILRILLPHGKL